MMLETPPPTGSPFVRVLKTEEKGSDVNLATHLLLDGFDGDYEVAIIISGDTDLVEPIRAVRYRLGLTVGVINPYPRPSSMLRSAASFYRHKALRPAILARCQFPATLIDRHGTITKPATW